MCYWKGSLCLITFPSLTGQVKPKCTKSRALMLFQREYSTTTFDLPLLLRGRKMLSLHQKGWEYMRGRALATSTQSGAKSLLMYQVVSWTYSETYSTSTNWATAVIKSQESIGWLAKLVRSSKHRSTIIVSNTSSGAQTAGYTSFSTFHSVLCTVEHVIIS